MTPATFLRSLDAHTVGQVRFILSHGKAQAMTGTPVLVDWRRAADAMDDGYSVKVHLASAGLVAIDVDAGAPQFMAMNPRLTDAPMITRPNAQDRAKVLVYCDSPPTIRREGDGRKIEVLTRDATVAGVHPSGAPYQARWDGLLIPVMSVVGVMALVDSFCPVTVASQEIRPDALPSVPHPTPPGAHESPVRAAIAWWNSQPGNVARVRDALAKRPQAGKFIALRDEVTPSAIESRTTAPGGGTTWYDYGSDRTLDAFDMAVTLGILPGDKRRAVAQVVDDYTLVTHGMTRSAQRRRELTR